MKKINIKTTVKSILKNIFQKNMNFGKYFPKTTRKKMEFQRCWKKHGGRREKFSLWMVQNSGPMLCAECVTD
jgi:hypothetical protein